MGCSPHGNIAGLPLVGQRYCAMTAIEIYSCLRDLQVVATMPHISEDEIRELVKRKLIQRTEKTGGIFLTPLGVHTKTGQL